MPRSGGIKYKWGMDSPSNPTRAQGLALFDTPVGTCAIAWGERGIVGVALPSGGDGVLRAQMRRRFPDAQEIEPPPQVSEAIARIRALLAGERDDLASIELDLEGVGEFHRRVYAAARAIPPGETLTYGELAKLLGDAGAARAVGQALGANPFPIIVPCHRILAASGKTGGFSAPGGATTKMKMLTIERAQPGKAPTLFPDLPLAAPPRRRR
jgi:methylated-DNA-[protein]-cysteine S-methyltransferase